MKNRRSLSLASRAARTILLILRRSLSLAFVRPMVDWRRRPMVEAPALFVHSSAASLEIEIVHHLGGTCFFHVACTSFVHASSAARYSAARGLYVRRTSRLMAHNFLFRLASCMSRCIANSIHDDEITASTNVARALTFAYQPLRRARVYSQGTEY